MLSFLSGVSWTYYLIAGLVIALLASGWLLKNQIEETGSLRDQNTTLQGQLAASEKDKADLSATLQSTAQKSLEDQIERDKLRSSVVILNKQISFLKRLTKEAPKDASNTASDDVYISDSLKQLLSDSYCGSIPGLCPNPIKSVK